MRFFIGSLVLLLVVVGCSPKVVPSTTAEVLDSTHLQVVYREVKVPVAGETVTVHDTIRCDEATNKPVAQHLFAKSGKATIDVSIKADGSATASGGCDSLSVIVKALDSTIFRLKSNKTSRVEVVYEHTPYWYDIASRWIAGVVVGSVVGYIAFRIMKFYIKPI